MKLLTIQHPYFIKIIIITAPLLAAAVWYCYVANPLSMSNGFVEHFFNRARKLHAEGKPHNAKQEYLQLLAHDPHCAAAHFNLAQLHAGDEQWHEACAHYHQAIQGIDVGQKYLVHFCYGTALFRLGKLEDAKTHLDNSIALQPTTKAHMQRSLVLQQMKQFDAALLDLNKAVEKEPTYARGYIELGNGYRDSHEFKKASECYQTCSTYMPEFYGPYLLRGDVVHLLAKETQNKQLIPVAMQLYEKAIECNPTCYQAQLNLGLMHMELNKDEQALELITQAHRNNPDFHFSNIAKGICHIKLGQLQEGWPGYEWRCKLSPSRFAHLPQWDGAQSLQGKTLLLHSEQGFGDTLHFVRYAQIAKKMGATVIIEVQARLKKLISLCPYIDTIITEHDSIPPCDYQLPLLSMPTVLKTSLETVPRDIPYLYADHTLVTQWQKELQSNTNLKIGICWQVNKEHDFVKYSNENVKLQLPSPRRSINLEQFAPLAQMNNTSVYALQFDADPQQCTALNIKTFANLDQTTSGPFMDTAAIIKNLDVIITVDTALAHLAGGLGAQTWILLPFAAEWRWMKDRTDTPWYPTARLFRCNQEGKWDEVIQEVITQLTPLIQEKTA